MKKIAVIGVGTAGLMAISHALAYYPEDWQVVSIHDPSIPILGIGESTSLAIPTSLYKSTGFTVFLDSDTLDSRLKLGAKYIGWREWDWYAKISPPAYAINFNNHGLKQMCFSRWPVIWKEKFAEVHGKVKRLVNEDTCATVIFHDDSKMDFDFIIDCRGYPEDYTNYDMIDSVSINHGLINIIHEPGTWDFTYQVAHRNGWMFGLPLNKRQGWGYLYNDRLTDKEDAIDDIAERFKTPKDKLNLKEFKWNNYRAKKFIDGRIAVNGNRALFYEPLEALAGACYSKINHAIYSFLHEGFPEITANLYAMEYAVDTQILLAYIYHGGSNYDTPFWKDIVLRSNKFLFDSNHKLYVQSMFKDIKADKDHEVSVDRPIGYFTQQLWKDFDHGLGYHYFTEPTENPRYPRFVPQKEFSNIRIS